MTIYTNKNNIRPPRMNVIFTYTELTPALEEYNKKYYHEDKSDWKGWCAKVEGKETLFGVGKSKNDSLTDLMSKIQIHLIANNFSL